MDGIEQFFGAHFRAKANRIQSYDYIEDFIARSHIDWSTAPNTAKVVEAFIREISALPATEFTFLVAHSGYIPEVYEADSSQETLYSKLIETVVLEWAIRMGFPESRLPTQKASMEDVSILDGEHVIVCDAKSFRLGRSQGAPNVKDVLKHADIEKWLSAYQTEEKLGGLVAFPSQHDWKKGSDFYQYTTDKSSPTASLYYEHLAFFLVAEKSSEDLINLYRNYADLFPKKITKAQNNRARYYLQVEEYLFSNEQKLWEEFKATAEKIVSERVFHCVHRLDKHLTEVREEIVIRYSHETDIEKLRAMAI